MKCPKCKKEIDDDSKSCPDCGYNIVADEGKYRKLYIILPVILLFAVVVAVTWYSLTMDKRTVYKVKEKLEKDGYTCTFEETKERDKVSKRYIFGTSEVADVHCYKEEDKRVYIYEMFFVDSYRYNFYVIEDKDYKKAEDTSIFRLSGLDYEIAKKNIETCETLKNKEDKKEEFEKNCSDYNENSLKYFDMYTEFLTNNRVKIADQTGK
jgi:hypothetical protein